MPDQRRDSLGRYSPDPIAIERSPQVSTYRILLPESPSQWRLTTGSKLYNLYRTRKKKVHIIEESPVRSRRQERLVRIPSPIPPTPPSPPSGPYYTMSSRLEDGFYAPLPPKLPSKGKHRGDDPIDHIVEERSPQLRKVKVIFANPDDEDAHPQVETQPSTGRRDSGKYYIVEPAESSGVRQESERRRPPDPTIQRLVDDLEREKRERREAELAAAAAEAAAERLKADLALEKRQRSLERRECAVRARQKLLEQEQARLVEVRRPRGRQDVVVVHNPLPAVLPTRDANRSALDRARDEYRRLHPEHTLLRDDQRPGTVDRRFRRQSVRIIDDERDRDLGHERDRDLGRDRDTRRRR